MTTIRFLSRISVSSTPATVALNAHDRMGAKREQYDMASNVRVPYSANGAQSKKRLSKPWGRAEPLENLAFPQGQNGHSEDECLWSGDRGGVLAGKRLRSASSSGDPIDVGLDPLNTSCLASIELHPDARTNCVDARSSDARTRAAYTHGHRSATDWPLMDSTAKLGYVVALMRAVDGVGNSLESRLAQRQVAPLTLPHQCHPTYPRPVPPLRGWPRPLSRLRRRP